MSTTKPPTKTPQEVGVRPQALTRSWVARRSLICLFVLCLGPGCKQGANNGQPRGATIKIQLTRAAFDEGADIPKQYTGDGEDVSPPLQWSEPPQGTKSLALICDD